MIPSNIFQGDDDQPLVFRSEDFSGGENTRQHASKIIPTQGEMVENFDIMVSGEVRKIPGLTLVEDLGSNPGVGLFGYEPDAGTNLLVAVHGATLATWPGSSTFTNRKTNFTTNLSTTIIKVGEAGLGDVFLVSNGTDNVFRFEPANLGTPQDLGDTNASPPKTSVLAYYRNRVWGLKNNLLYFSDAFPADYETAFDRTTNAFRVPVGTARGIIPIREAGIAVIGADQVWSLSPSFTPGANDEPQKILDIGCMANNTCKQVSDDIWFFAPDGVRGVFRTQQDKLQIGQSFPLSFLLKSRFAAINWTYMQNATAIYWDNKYILSLPTDSSTYNNEVWIFYPSLLVSIGNNITVPAAVVIKGWNVAQWAKIKFGGEEKLYAIDSVDGSVYRAWSGTDNNGTAITSVISGKEENFGAPLVYKVGGELEVECEVAGSGNSLSINVALDGGNFQALGTIDLSSSTAPTLPVSLPFTLADSYVIRKKFHLAKLGRFKTLQWQIINSDKNTDPIVIYSVTVNTFPEELQDE